MGEGNSPIQAKGVNCLLSRELSKDSYDHYSPALIPFYFYFTSLVFPQNIVERQCCSYWFLFAHVNDTAPSSGDSVLKSLIKCHGLWAYGLCSLPGSSNWQQGSSSTPWREIFLKSENAVLLSHDKNHWSAYVQPYIAFPYSSHPICNPLLAIMLQ